MYIFSSCVFEIYTSQYFAVQMLSFHQKYDLDLDSYIPQLFQTCLA